MRDTSLYRLAGCRKSIFQQPARSEELYHITQGTARMQLGEDEFDIQSGDTICIPPGTPHCVHNNGDKALVILCCCAPPYQYNDTELLE